ncbi:hypothetical protein FA95DRAFT_1564481 [Auriscalpium vulgare]|uniref:Uncharacterized protein n=1 Tax=Auriscalpium vulgare TaxID=40419 RepID=A0ACB8RDQ0_9AGAM|nr:hypothetical protein FA95DRAFT_1564481 [Auriscalpium vulgare]
MSNYDTSPERPSTSRMSRPVQRTRPGSSRSSGVPEASKEPISICSSDDEDDIWHEFEEPDADDMEEVEHMIAADEALTPSRRKGKERADPFHRPMAASPAQAMGSAGYSPASSVAFGYPTPTTHRTEDFEPLPNCNTPSRASSGRRETTYAPVPQFKRPSHRPPTPDSPSAKRHQREASGSLTKTSAHRAKSPLAAPIFTPVASRPLSPPRLPLSALPSPSLPPEDVPPAGPSHTASSVNAPPEEPLGALVDNVPDLPYEIIAFNEHFQADMDRRDISWAVQYAIMCGLTCKRWELKHFIPSVLNQLKGKSADALRRLPKLMHESVSADAARFAEGLAGDFKVWQEYDREDEAILEGKGRGLGPISEDSWHGETRWYGGKIQQVVCVSIDPATKALSFTLEAPEMRRSNRFARILGSRRMLEFKLAREFKYDSEGTTLKHLLRNFVLCGRVFVPIALKDDKVYLMEIKNDYQRLPSAGDDQRMGYWEFIEKHNSLDMNRRQPISKYVTRFGLSFSTSVPILEFDPMNIYFIGDETAPHDGPGKAPSEKIMTDGCGFINQAALILIAQRLQLSSRPTAVQGRIAGSKGLWVLHPTDRASTDPPRIYIRASQRKILLPDLASADRAHLIFDMVSISKPPNSGRLSQQTILCMWSNGVPTYAFKDLLEEGMRAEVEPLMRWTGAVAMQMLWHAVERAGNVAGIQVARLAGAMARALGLRQRWEDDISDDGTPQEDVELAALLDAADPTHSLHGSVMAMLQVGFEPQHNTLLYDKIRKIMQLVMDAYIDKYRIAMKQSAEAYIVPDPKGVLKKGQIHFKSSKALKDPIEDMAPNIITGKVLVSRNPTRVASDIQKVEAIEHPELSEYVDVIVFPVEGPRSLASYLGGGDYDGDTVMVTWAAPIVDNFKEDERVMDKPDGFDDENFESEVEQVVDFHDRLSALPKTQAHAEFLKVLLQGLGNGTVGMYSGFHDRAVYAFGYSDPETVRLAYMFTTCLDASKTGLRVRPKVFSADKRKYDWAKPACMVSAKNAGSVEKPPPHLQRRDSSKKFVLESIRRHGQELQDSLLIAYGNVQPSKRRDLDLVEPVENLLRLVQSYGPNHAISEAIRAELDLVNAHVSKIRAQFAKASFSNDSPYSPRKTPSRGKPVRSNSTQAIGQLKREFCEGPPPEQIPILTHSEVADYVRAAYAYKKATEYDATSTAFPFAMAFETLCQIKARARGNSVTMRRSFANLLNMSSSTVRILHHLVAAEREE